MQTFNMLEDDNFSLIKLDLFFCKKHYLPPNKTLQYKRIKSKSLNMNGYFAWFKGEKDGQLMIVKNNKIIDNITFFNPKGYSNGQLINKIKNLLVFV